MGQATHLRLVSDRAPALEARLVAASASFSDAERAVVASALDLAAAALHGVIRRSGEPALTHALGTADVLLALRLDHEAVSAALLSPVLATASAAAAKIREQFGNTIASLAEGAGRMDEIGALTARQLPGKKPEQQAAQLEALRKMLLAMVEDVRVVLIKLADHTHELRYVIRCDDQSLRREVA